MSDASFSQFCAITYIFSVQDLQHKPCGLLETRLPRLLLVSLLESPPSPGVAAVSVKLFDVVWYYKLHILKFVAIPSVTLLELF